MPSAEFSAFLAARAAMPAPDPENQPPLAERRAGFDAMFGQMAPDDATVCPVAEGEWTADWVSVPGADAGRRLVYFHGGGYSVGSPVSHRRLAADLSRASGCVVLNVHYRMAPEDPHPAAVADGVAAYLYARTHSPEGESAASAVFIAGDSAGGGLALATIVSLRDRGETLPEAAATFSAWTDLACESPSLASRATRDPIISAEGVGGAAALYVADGDPRNPTVSPAYADFTGFPPLYLNVGDDEVLLDDTLRVAERARAAGVEVTLHVEPEAFHVYPFFVPDAPESRRAIEAVGRFVSRNG